MSLEPAVFCREMIINDGKRHQCAPHLHSLSEHHQPVTTTPDDKYADPFPTLSEHACKRKFDNEKCFNCRRFANNLLFICKVWLIQQCILYFKSNNRDYKAMWRDHIPPDLVLDVLCAT